MSNQTNPPSSNPRRADALDALRGLAILAMLLSGQLPFGEGALPSWMYHAQVPPPKHEWIGTLPGITWVDLVFPFFLFSMGAALPLALYRRLEQGWSKSKTIFSALERGFLLLFFALYVQAIRPYVLSDNPGMATWLLALFAFLLLFAILTRLPPAWKASVRWMIRATGWTGVILFLALARYPKGEGFSLSRYDIIIVVLANMAVFGTLVWLFTRERLLIRLGILGLLCAFRLSNMPRAVPGWPYDLWSWPPPQWTHGLYSFYYLQYLFIVIAGTIAGDLIHEWLLEREFAASDAPSLSHSSWPRWQHASIAGLMATMVLVALIGLKARWLLPTTLALFGLLCLGWFLLRAPANSSERLIQKLFNWAIYWVVLGLCFEPYEGGIKKDKATMSYYFVTTGLAICTFIFFMIVLESFGRRRWLQVLIDNGQNPMIAYAGINNFIIPLLALVSADKVLNAIVISPWLGFVKALIITILLALFVSFCTRRKIFWRT